MQQYLQVKNSKGMKLQSTVDPINYRVITVAPPGDGILLARCQESCFLLS
jgi:hypothetical protein